MVPAAPPLDILFGGIPRSGTTALARAVDRHPDVFCWFSETGLLPRIAELCGALPLLPENLPTLARILKRHLHAHLVEMPAWSVEQFKDVGAPVIVPQDAERLANQVIAILARRLSADETLIACSEALRAFFAPYSRRRLIAEKSPSNALLFEQHAGLSPRWVFTHRDPFAVLSSMAARIGDPYAGAFAGPVEQRIGLYLDHARSILAAGAQPARARVIGFHQLVEECTPALNAVCELIGTGADPVVLEDMGAILGGDPRRSAWQSVPALERWKVLHLCGPEMRRLGYDESFYAASREEMAAAGPAGLEAAVVPIHGFSQAGPADCKHWMGRRGGLAVYAPLGVDTLILSSYRTMEQLAGPAAALGVDLRNWQVDVFARSAQDHRLPLGQLPLADAGVSEWTLDLKPLEPLAHAGRWRLFNLVLETNFAYVPAFSLPGGTDSRILSVLVWWSLR